MEVPHLHTLLPGTQVEARGLPWEVVHSEPSGEQHRLRLRCLQGDLQGIEVDFLHDIPLNENLPKPVIDLPIPIEAETGRGGSGSLFDGLDDDARQLRRNCGVRRPDRGAKRGCIASRSHDRVTFRNAQVSAEEPPDCRDLPPDGRG
ncbi:MAG: hypothetical protein Q7U75_11565 [Desulfobacterales bacterium]|nr:hypothetical protein [Desulfobacterales bacterium]